MNPEPFAETRWKPLGSNDDDEHEPAQPIVILPPPVSGVELPCGFERMTLRHAVRSDRGRRSVRRIVCEATALACAVLGLFLTAGAAEAQERDQVPDGIRLQGIVYDIATGEAIAGAVVFLEGLQRRASSDAEGVFSMDRVASGAHVISVTRFGYEKQDLTVNLASDAGGFLEVALTPRPLLLDSVTVVSTPQPVRVRGVVYDAVSGLAIPGAAVLVDAEGHGVVADSSGVFVVEDVTAGPQVVSIKQIGYEAKVVAVTVTGHEEEVVEVGLTPKPFLLDGITAVARNVETMETRLRSRRGAASVHRGLIRAFDKGALLSSGARTGLEFLDRHTFVRTMPCPMGEFAYHCVARGGRVGEPTVYIDEVYAPGGLDALEQFPTSALYLVEVFSSGSEIRAYTYAFMDRTARRPVALIPALLWRWP